MRVVFKLDTRDVVSPTLWYDRMWSNGVTISMKSLNVIDGLIHYGQGNLSTWKFISLLYIYIIQPLDNKIGPRLVGFASSSDFRVFAAPLISNFIFVLQNLNFVVCI